MNNLFYLVIHINYNEGTTLYSIPHDKLTDNDLKLLTSVSLIKYNHVSCDPTEQQYEDLDNVLEKLQELSTYKVEGKDILGREHLNTFVIDVLP